MRPLKDTRARWNLLFSDESIGIDLRQAVKDRDAFDPCADGLRSICWKVFLLYGPLSRSSWPKKLTSSRNAYSSLRDHFLKNIDHPNDLESTLDPLTDDDNSPWSTLRQDETSRGEIFQDVERCLQENFFFREPSTQKTLLDILFIYSKLHPDIGYRQGMHELLAPILWVIERDAIDGKTLNDDRTAEEKKDDELMLDALDAKYIEHDTFTLFCAVMQTAKAFYEVGETPSASPIVARSRRIHEEVLGLIDPDLAQHLHAVEILPQIFLIRWIRLLFGREFAFDDVLSLWDVLFAESLSLALIDLTCIAMLLRIRWQLMDSDYTSALTLLLRYTPPAAPRGPASLVADAKFLEHNKTPDGGAELVLRYSGKRPTFKSHKQPPSTARNPTIAGDSRSRASSIQRAHNNSSPARSPARLLPQQKALEGIFQEVSGGLQRRTEGWSISKAVKGAVGEVRRNMTSLQSGTNSPRSSMDIVRRPADPPEAGNNDNSNLAGRIQKLEERNKALAQMLGDALESLRALKDNTSNIKKEADEDSFNITLAKLQFVQVYLADPEVPMPSAELTESSGDQSSAVSVTKILDVSAEEDKAPINQTEGSQPSVKEQPTAEANDEGGQSTRSAQELHLTPPSPESELTLKISPSRQVRPSLEQSSFSWILGETRHRSSFVQSMTIPPEQRRESESKSRPRQLFAEGKGGDARRGSDVEDDGFTLSSLRGHQAR